MGLFDLFKKKEAAEPQPVRNNPNSVFTMRFTVPFFQIFDKTDPELSALPIKMGATGSCQYRISEPDLCFDNVPLAEMSPEQLEAHVKDALTMNIKTYFNSITTIPLLQFESMIAKISDAAKSRLTPILNDEFGVNLRAFSISGVRYDTEDPNYLKLQTISRKVMDNRAKKVDVASDIELEHMKIDSEISAKRKQELTGIELERQRKEHEMELRKKQEELDAISERNQIELDTFRAEKELERKHKDLDLARAGKTTQIELERQQKEYELELKRKQDEFALAQKREQDMSDFELETLRAEKELERRRKEQGLGAVDTSGGSGNDDFDVSGLDDDFKL